MNSSNNFWSRWRFICLVCSDQSCKEYNLSSKSKYILIVLSFSSKLIISSASDGTKRWYKTIIRAMVCGTAMSNYIKHRSFNTTVLILGMWWTAAQFLAKLFRCTFAICQLYGGHFQKIRMRWGVDLKVVQAFSKWPPLTSNAIVNDQPLSVWMVLHWPPQEEKVHFHP